MPVFSYTGFNKAGANIKGTIEADGAKNARLQLRREGVLVTQISESGKAVAKREGLLGKEINLKKYFQSVKIEELGLMTRQLGTLLQAGVPMVDSIRALIDQVDNELLKQTLSQIRADVNEGTSLASAMQKHKIFSNIYVNMVSAGETSGTLEHVLMRLADFIENQSKLRSKIVGAMMYPFIMIIVAVIVVGVMLTVVVPRITGIFTSAGMQLPLMTRILIGSSKFMGSWWWLILLIVGIAWWRFKKYINTETGRLKWDRFTLKAPIFGEIIRLVAVARFARTLSTLLKSGVPMLTTLQITRNVVSNRVLELAIDEVRDSVREGEDIATPLKRSNQFPPMVIHMIAIGEKSGELENMLAKIADTYEQQVDTKVGMLTSVLEPVMILVMGGVIGFIVFAVLFPMMQMSQIAQ